MLHVVGLLGDIEIMSIPNDQWRGYWYAIMCCLSDHASIVRVGGCRHGDEGREEDVPQVWPQGAGHCNWHHGDHVFGVRYIHTRPRLM
jgi:hypothetical protein